LIAVGVLEPGSTKPLVENLERHRSPIGTKLLSTVT